jgi:hypothetical protein
MKVVEMMFVENMLLPRLLLLEDVIVIDFATINYTLEMFSMIYFLNALSMNIN